MTEDILEQTYAERVEEIVQLRDEAERLKRELADKEQTLLALMETQGIPRITTDDGLTCALGKPRFHASVSISSLTDEDRTRIRSWCEERGLPWSVHHSTFSSWVANLMEQGEALPPEIKTWEQRGLTIRKPRSTVDQP